MPLAPSPFLLWFSKFYYPFPHSRLNSSSWEYLLLKVAARTLWDDRCDSIMWVVEHNARAVITSFLHYWPYMWLWRPQNLAVTWKGKLNHWFSQCIENPRKTGLANSLLIVGSYINIFHLVLGMKKLILNIKMLVQDRACLGQSGPNFLLETILG